MKLLFKFITLDVHLILNSNTNLKYYPIKKHSQDEHSDFLKFVLIKDSPQFMMGLVPNEPTLN